jgi:hypothetical protein
MMFKYKFITFIIFYIFYIFIYLFFFYFALVRTLQQKKKINMIILLKTINLLYIYMCICYFNYKSTLNYSKVYLMFKYF